MKKTIITRTAIALAAVGLWATPEAKATLSFLLDNGNTPISGYPTPFGKVDITRVDNNTATVTATAFTSGIYGYSFGDGSTIALNLTGSGLSYTFGSGTKVGGGAAASADYSQSSGTVDGWGSFNFVLDTTDGFSDSVTALTFTINNTSGAWTSESAMLTTASNPYDVAGHVFVRASGTNTGVTGFSTGTPVPEPTTVLAGALLLLPFGASALRILRKRRTA